MSSSFILQNKHAVVFGAGGSVGAAVAREFAAEGAEVFLASRTKPNVEAAVFLAFDRARILTRAVVNSELPQTS
jgi:NAD(P)-dependent dehydrogenase (short-subunit alcohol dehydrogenase family)